MKEGSVRAQEVMPGLRGLNSICLHTVQGASSIPKICIRNYECGHCPFDQWIDELQVDMKANEVQMSS